MKAEIYQDEGYKLMSAPLQLGLVTRSVGAERALGQPGGLPDISRGLSASGTPGTPPTNGPHPGGVPKPTGHSQCVSPPFFCARFWHPTGVHPPCVGYSGVSPHSVRLNPRLISASPSGSFRRTTSKSSTIPDL